MLVIERLSIKTCAVAVLVILLLASLNPPVFGVDTGWVNPTQNQPVPDLWDGLEVNPTSAYAQGGKVAASIFTPDVFLDGHMFWGYNFRLPAGATITGIEIRVDWYVAPIGEWTKMTAAVLWNRPGWEGSEGGSDDNSQVSMKTSLFGGPQTL